nr:MAG TPA: hypothetical protein [Caudoviricetes sp.]
MNSAGETPRLPNQSRGDREQYRNRYHPRISREAESAGR